MKMDSEGEKEGTKAENDFVEYFHKPAFKKLFVNGLNFDAMRIPTAFVDLMEKMVPKMATLYGSSGGHWQTKVVKEEEEIYLEDGWEKFRQDNNLSDGDVLLFRYSGNWCFDVEIFGPDGLEKKMHNFEEGKQIRQRKVNFKKRKEPQAVNRKKIGNSGENEESQCSIPRRKSRRSRKQTVLLSPKKQGLKSDASPLGFGA